MSDSPARQEPARRVYFFDGAWADWAAVARAAWTNSYAVSRRQFEATEELSAVFFWATGLAVIVGCAAAILVFNTVFALALLLGTLAFGLLLAGPALVETLCWSRYKIFYPCPVCHDRCALPAFVCPQCERRHKRLSPNACGILTHRCFCGNRLPANFWNGRQALEARCPSCDEPMDGRLTQPYCIPLVGAPAHGKSEFLYRATDLLFARASRRGWKFALHGPHDRQVHEALAAQFLARDIHKTREPVPRALRFRVNVAGEKVERQLSLYDPAGEAFFSAEQLDQHRYYEYACGIVFLLDPFTLPGVQGAFTAERPGGAEEHRLPETGLENCFPMLRLALEKCGRLQHGERTALPIAVVLTKGDVLGLAARILRSPGEDMDEKCRSFLAGTGCGQFVGRVTAMAEQCRFFLSGRPAPDVPAEVEDAAAPLRWLLTLADPQRWEDGW